MIRQIQAKKVKASIAEPLREGILSLVKLLVEDQQMRDLQEWGIDNGVEMDNEGNISLDSIDIPQLQEIYHALEIMAYGESSGEVPQADEDVKTSASLKRMNANVNSFRDRLNDKFSMFKELWNDFMYDDKIIEEYGYDVGINELLSGTYGNNDQELATSIKKIADDSPFDIYKIIVATDSEPRWTALKLADKILGGKGDTFDGTIKVEKDNTPTVEQIIKSLKLMAPNVTEDNLQNALAMLGIKASMVKNDKVGTDGTSSTVVNFNNQTKHGYEIKETLTDEYNRKIIIGYRPRIKDYFVGVGYDADTGEWGQGYYDYTSAADAETFVKKRYPSAK